MITMEEKWFTQAPVHDIAAALRRVEGELAAWYRGHNTVAAPDHLMQRAAALRDRARREGKA